MRQIFRKRIVYIPLLLLILVGSSIGVMALTHTVFFSRSEGSTTIVPTPTAQPFSTPIKPPTATPTPARRAFVLPCQPQGRLDNTQLSVKFLEVDSFDTTTSTFTTKNLGSQFGNQQTFKAIGDTLVVTIKTVMAVNTDGLSCLHVIATWPGMPKNISGIMGVHDYSNDAYQGEFIINPNALPLSINLEKSMYVPNSGVVPTAIPFGIPITLSIKVSTVNGALFDSSIAGTVFTFIRSK